MDQVWTYHYNLPSNIDTVFHDTKIIWLSVFFFRCEEFQFIMVFIGHELFLNKWLASACNTFSHHILFGTLSYFWLWRRVEGILMYLQSFLFLRGRQLLGLQPGHILNSQQDMTKMLKKIDFFQSLSRVDFLHKG